MSDQPERGSMQHSTTARLVSVAFAIALFATGCVSSDDDSAEDDSEAPPATGAVVDGGSEPAPTEASPEGSSDGQGGGIDPLLTRDDIDCSEDGLGSTDETEFINAHVVVGGVLGALCYGDEDPTLITAWEELAIITPGLQLADLGLFGGFISGEGGEETTLAFVNTLDDDGTLFQMSVNLDSYDEDANEARLTMAHEFSHVFTALPSQIDRSAEAADSCATYDNAEGCYAADSIMAQWIALFWGNGLIDQIDPNTEATGAEGEARCDVNPGFFGPYAASNPEEDFAESFSAFVYRLETATPEQQAKFDWMAAQPGLAEFRDRAVSAGVGPLENNFEACGSDA